MVLSGQGPRNDYRFVMRGVLPSDIGCQGEVATRGREPYNLSVLSDAGEGWA
jgi:hypothetical protein